MFTVDFNHWKTVNNWPALAAAVDAIILKATQYTTFLDLAFAANLAQARKTGKLIGVYHFVGRNGMQSAKLPPGDPVAEANWFLSRYAHQPGEIPIVDYEPDAEPADPDSWLAAHCGRIRDVLGVPPVVYMNSSTAKKRSWAKTRALGCALWVAQYGANNGQPGTEPTVGSWGSFIGWQYTSNGALPGISAQVDLSRFDLTADQWRAYGGAGGPLPAPKVMEDDMRLIRDPNSTVWAWADTDVTAIGSDAQGGAYSAVAQRAWGPITDVSAAELAAIQAYVAAAQARRDRLAADVHGKVVDSRFPVSDRQGGNAPDTDDMLGHILSTRAGVADLAAKVATVQTGGVDAGQVAALVIDEIKAIFAAQQPPA